MPSTEPGRRLTRQERLILLVLATVQFTSIVDFMVIMPLAPQLKRAIGLTTDRFALVVAAYTVAAGLAGLISTLFLDRFARRPTYLVLFAGFLIGTLACGIAPDFVTLVAARALTGAFGGILGGMAMTIIGDVFPENRRGAATGILMMSFSMASVLGVPIGLTLGQEYGWHIPFLVLAALCVPFFILAACVLPRLDGHLKGQVREESLAHLKAIFLEANHLRAFALMSALMISGFSVLPFLSAYLVSNVGVAEKHLRWAYVAGGIVTLGWNADHRPAGRPLRQAPRVPVCGSGQRCAPLDGDQLAPPAPCPGVARHVGHDAQQWRANGSGDGDDHLQRRPALAGRLHGGELGHSASLLQPRSHRRRLHPVRAAEWPDRALPHRRPDGCCGLAVDLVARRPASAGRCCAGRCGS